MIKIISGTLFLYFFLSFNLQASTAGYNITIDEKGYLLNIEMIFDQGVNLLNVREALKNGKVLSLLSPNVVSVTNTKINEDEYKSLMVVKSFGISSNLLSMCDEKLNENKWSRSCVLQTNDYDGGKYMEWKSDEVECLKKNPNVIDCHFTIKGKAKPVKIFGLQILSAKLFSVKAKLQAMNNFFKLYYYIKNYNLSPKMALSLFSKSKFKDELNQFEKKATDELKTQPQFKRSFVFQD